MKIKKASLTFRPLTHRSQTDGVVVHHPAWFSCSIQDIHHSHLGRNFRGAGYHFLIRKNGDIWEGRPLWAMGEHTSGHNSNTIGVCFEGYFHPRPNGQSTDTEMSTAQKEAGETVIKYLLNEYPSIKFIKGHYDLASTACPGHYFPMNHYKEMLGGTNVRALKQGMRGNDVKGFQQDLIALGYGSIMEPHGADGSFGKATGKAVRAFQEDQGILVDGSVGPQTRQQFEKALEDNNKESNVVGELTINGETYKVVK